MRLCRFEISKIGPMFSDMEPPFARATVKIGVRDEESEAINTIDLDVITHHQDTDTLDAVKTRILAEALRALRAAVSLLDGKDVQSLCKLVETDEKDMQVLTQRRWESRNPTAG